jgi:tRNA (guanine37-N1)-methyltransferase
MNFSIVTLFPDIYKPFFTTSLIGRAINDGLLSADLHSLLSFCSLKERIDAPTVGHGPGMLLRPEIVEKAILAGEQKFGTAYKIFFSPHGQPLTQPLLAQLLDKIRERGNHCMLLPARYEGMDARLEEEYADVVLSIGDYVLMGGDLPAMVFMEAISRLIPGVIGSKASIEEESFSGPFMDHPHFTLPVEWRGRRIPDVLRSGDHGAQAAWRRARSIERTVFGGHFDWMRTQDLTENDVTDVVRILPYMRSIWKKSSSGNSFDHFLISSAR